jgi:hypothetical protein
MAIPLIERPDGSNRIFTKKDHSVRTHFLPSLLRRISRQNHEAHGEDQQLIQTAYQKIVNATTVDNEGSISVSSPSDNSITYTLEAFTMEGRNHLVVVTKSMKNQNNTPISEVTLLPAEGTTTATLEDYQKRNLSPQQKQLEINNVLQEVNTALYSA